MKKKIIIYTVFSIVLLTAFYISLSFTKGYFDVKLPVMSYVQNFSFTDQNGQPVTEKNLKGKVYRRQPRPLHGKGTIRMPSSY